VKDRRGLTFIELIVILFFVSVVGVCLFWPFDDAASAEPNDPRVPVYVTGSAVNPWTGSSFWYHSGTAIGIPLPRQTEQGVMYDYMDWRALQRQRAEEAAVDLMDKVYFEFNSSEISERAGIALDGVAEILLANPEIRLHVDGHTDLVGTDEYNHALAWRRSLSVVVALMTRGIEAYRLLMDTFGEEVPVDPTPDASLMNRRVEITPVVILP
jgi:outer membrane protein OmpA-like peptidoglycan-associated protein